jgi:5-methyltetrahydropteroyltriglutamate--homocysteine methyltransferase
VGSLPRSQAVTEVVFARETDAKRDLAADDAVITAAVDIPRERLLPVVIKAKPQGLLFEAANPRHAHEWQVFRKIRIPDDKIMIPGLLTTTTNYIEHPELVAERIERFAQVVGRDRVIAGTDCGLGTFAGFGPAEPDIAYLKLRSLVEGAQIASARLWH